MVLRSTFSRLDFLLGLGGEVVLFSILVLVLVLAACLATLKPRQSLREWSLLSQRKQANLLLF